MRRPWVVVICLCAAAVSAWSATEESAPVAVDQGLPGLADETRSALVSLLASLQNGDKLTVTLNQRECTFEVEGETVSVVGAQAAPESVARLAGATAPSGFRSALAFALKKQVDLPPLKGELERNNIEILEASNEVVSFRYSATGDMGTVTWKGTVCVRCPKALEGLAIVDQLGTEAQEALRYLRKVNAAISDEQADLGWRARRYYSDPAYTYKIVGFATAARRATGTRGAGGGGARSADFEALLRIPDIQTREARIRVYPVEPKDKWLPGVLLDEREVIPMLRYEGPPGVADVTRALVYGDHRLTTKGGTRLASHGLDVEVELIAGAGDKADFQAVAWGRTIPSVSSEPIDELQNRFPSMAEALAR